MLFDVFSLLLPFIEHRKLFGYPFDHRTLSVHINLSLIIIGGKIVRYRVNFPYQSDTLNHTVHQMRAFQVESTTGTVGPWERLKN